MSSHMFYLTLPEITHSHAPTDTRTHTHSAGDNKMKLVQYKITKII